MPNAHEGNDGCDKGWVGMKVRVMTDVGFTTKVGFATEVGLTTKAWVVIEAMLREHYVE